MAIEARFNDRIDWKNYADTVQEHPVIGANDEKRYTENGQTIVVPSREHGFVSYQLTDGRTIYVANGEAVGRDNRMPRATSTSCTENAIQHLLLPDKASLLAMASAPHLRSAVDTTITYLDAVRLGAIRPIDRIDVASVPWITRQPNT